MNLSSCSSKPDMTIHSLIYPVLMKPEPRDKGDSSFCLENIPAARIQHVEETAQDHSRRL